MDLNEVRTVLLGSLGPFAYPVFFGLLVLASLGFPLNSDLLMILGGALAGAGHLDVRILILGTPFAILVGDTITFFIGRNHGHKILKTKFFRRIIPDARQKKIHDLAKKYGSRFIFMIRFTPGLRAITFFTAGTLQVKPSDFFKMNTAATLIYTPSLISLAYFTASRFQVWVDGYHQFSKWFLMILGSLLIYGFTRFAARKLMESRNA